MYSTGIANNEIPKQGYHFVWNGQLSVGYLGSRRSKMSPAGFIEVWSLGVQKVIFGGCDKNSIFFCKLLTIANILRILKKIAKNLIF
jgi:hypothetical protein